MPIPTVLVNGSSPPYQATSGQAITVSLVNSSGVYAWNVTVIGVDNSNPTPPTITINQSTYTASFNMTGTGTALLMQSTVNNGIDSTGIMNPMLTTTFKVHVLGTYGNEVYALGEHLESGPFGWLPALNNAGSGGSGFVAGGDLSGTTTSQTVIGLRGISISTTSPTGGQVLEYNSGTGKWTPTALPSSLPPSGSAGGDLSGTYPNPTVVALQTNAVQSGVLGSAQDGYTLTWHNASSQWQALPTGTGSTVLSGDVTGANTATTVVKLRGVSVSSTAPTTNQVLEYNGTAWTPTALPSSLPPSGSAGGDLSGTYPNPTVAKINSTTVPAGGSLTTGNQLIVNGASSATWVALNLAGGSGYVTGSLPTANQVAQSITLTGDVTSSGGTTASASTVLATVNSNVGSFGSATQVATFTVNAKGLITAAGNTTISGVAPGGSAGGDLSGTYPNPTVAKINGTSVPATPSANQILVASSGTAATWTSTLPGNYSFTGTPTFSNTLALNTTGTSGGLTGSPSITVSGITDSGLSTGVVHSGSGGAFTSSLIVNADIAAAGTANIAVNKLASGSVQQILMNNSFPTPTWTSISGDININSTGGVTVSGLEGQTVYGGATNAQMLIYKSSGPTGWSPATISGDATITNVGAITVGAIQGNTVTSGALTKGQFLIASTTSNWAATSLSGDVTESATTPGALTVGQLQGSVVLSGTPSSGQVLTATSSTAAHWATPSGGSFTAGGDLSGTSSSQTVIGIQGTAVPAPSGTNTVLQYSGSSLAWNAVSGVHNVPVSSLKTSNYTVLTTDYIVGIGILTASITITLPSSPSTGDTYVVKDVNGTCQQFVRDNAGTLATVGYIVTVTPSSGNIDGLANYILQVPYQSVTLVYTGSQWSAI